jgi:uncharacterized protein YegJ (DUF2314 family)
MIKTILQLAFATGLWFGLGNAHWGIKVGAIMVGILVLHWIWERIFYGPSTDFHVMQVAHDDPLLLAAMERGKATFGKFLEIYPQHEADSAVRFAFKTDTGTVENLWGDLLKIDERHATVLLRTEPVEHKGELEQEMVIDRDQIHDWQVAFADGTSRGGYTIVAMLKIHEREQGELPAQVRRQIQQFKEIDW